VAEATLVEADIDAGEKLLVQLDRSKFPVFAAFWMLQSESGEWRLILGTPVVDQAGTRSAYRRLQEQTKGRVSPPVPLSDISLVGTTDPLVKLLGQAIQTGPGVSRIRFSHNVIDGVLIQDALIYRMTNPRPTES
jgi:hypothetical protein